MTQNIVPISVAKIMALDKSPTLLDWYDFIAWGIKLIIMNTPPRYPINSLSIVLFNIFFNRLYISDVVLMTFSDQ